MAADPKKGGRRIGLDRLLRRIGRLADPTGPPDLVTAGPHPDPAAPVRLEEGLHGGRPGLPARRHRARLCFHLQQPSYNTDTLIGVLDQLKAFYAGQRVVLIWDGLSSHWSHRMRAYLDSQRDWLLRVERLPAYAPELNAVEYLWANLDTVLPLAGLGRQGSDGLDRYQ